MDTQDYYSVGPGFLGFVATFFMAVALVLLYMSMRKHLRKVRRDAQLAEQARADAAAGKAPKIPPARSGRVEDGEGRGDVVADESGDS